METVNLVVISVISTLCFGSLVYLLYSVRSLQKKIKTLSASNSLQIQTNEDLYKCIDENEGHCTTERNDLGDDLYREIDNLQKKFEGEMDKRFDKCYRTQYEFRDWSKEQIERLIENDLDKSK